MVTSVTNETGTVAMEETVVAEEVALVTTTTVQAVCKCRWVMVACTLISRASLISGFWPCSRSFTLASHRLDDLRSLGLQLPHIFYTNKCFWLH